MPKQKRDELLALLETVGDENGPAGFEAWLEQVSPSWTWHWRHLVYIRAQLECVTQGSLRRLLLQVPPRHGKSEMVTVRYAAYRLERQPVTRVIIGCYSTFLALKFSRKIRRLLDGRVVLSRERRAMDDWELDNGTGGLRAVGVGSGITGTGGDLILIDDPVKNRQEANSERYREAVAEWYQDDLYTRLEPGGAIVLTMTRWHEDDLAGRILRNDFGDADEWTQVNLPALAEDDDPLGRTPGEALCPERYDETALARIRNVLGDSFFALYQGRPVAAEGNIIKKHWIRRYTALPEPGERLMRVQSWDTGTKEKELNDPSVCTTWEVTRKHYYLADEWRGRVEYPSLRQQCIVQAERYQPSAVLIEDKGNGSALIQDLRANTRLPVVPIEPAGDKVMRLSAESAAYEAGLVLHPLAGNAPWVTDFEAELVSIPNATHDDRGDSVSQFLKWVRQRAGVFEYASTGRRESVGAWGDGPPGVSRKGFGSVGGSGVGGW